MIIHVLNLLASLMTLFAVWAALWEQPEPDSKTPPVS
jgi:hypothetical protein